MRTRSKSTHHHEDEGEDKEEGREDKDEDNNGAVPGGSRVSDDDEGSNDDAELDAELKAVFDKDDDNDPQELTEHEVVEFIKFIWPLQEAKYVLP